MSGKRTSNSLHLQYRHACSPFFGSYTCHVLTQMRCTLLCWLLWTPVETSSLHLLQQLGALLQVC